MPPGPRLVACNEVCRFAQVRAGQGSGHSAFAGGLGKQMPFLRLGVAVLQPLMVELQPIGPPNFSSWDVGGSLDFVDLVLAHGTVSLPKFGDCCSPVGFSIEIRSKTRPPQGGKVPRELSDPPTSQPCGGLSSAKVVQPTHLCCGCRLTFGQFRHGIQVSSTMLCSSPNKFLQT